MKLAFLAKGLVIRRRGVLLEFKESIGATLRFEEPESGVAVTLSDQVFFDEWRNRQIEPVEAFSSPRELDYPAQSQEAPAAQSTASLPEEYQEKLVRQWHYIVGISRRNVTRGQLNDLRWAIQEVAAQIDDKKAPGVSTVSGWMKRFEEAGGDIAALTSGNYCKSRGKCTDAKHDALIIEVIETEYGSRNRKRKRRAYGTYKKKLKEHNVARIAEGLDRWIEVSESTFQRRIAAMDQFELEEKRSGTQEATRKFGMLRGHLRQGRVLDFVEIDHTRLDAYTIDDESFVPLGRPWFTVIRDRRSGVVLGFFLGFVPPSLESTFGAIRHSLLPHGAINSRWPEIENPWPAFGRGQVYVCDRGPEFVSARFRLALAELLADVMYNEVKRPWHKGGVESLMHDLASLLECIPGRTFKPLEKVPGYNPKRDAVVRFSVLSYLIHKWASDIHNARKHPQLGAPRIQVFMDEVAYAPPPLLGNLDNLDVTFGTHCHSTLSRKGLTRHYLNYSSDELEDVWRVRGDTPHFHYIAPSNSVGEIWVPNPKKAGQHFAVPCLEQVYANGKNSFQHRLIRARADKALLSRDPTDALWRAEAAIADTIAEEIQRRDTASKSRYARAVGIDSNAVLKGTAGSVKDAEAAFRRQPPKPSPEADISFCDVRPFPSWRTGL